MLKVGDTVARYHDGKVVWIYKVHHVWEQYIGVNCASGICWEVNAIDGRHYRHFGRMEEPTSDPYSRDYIILATERDLEEFRWRQARKELAKVNWDQLPVEKLEAALAATRERRPEEGEE